MFSQIIIYIKTKNFLVVNNITIFLFDTSNPNNETNQKRQLFWNKIISKYISFKQINVV